MNKTIYLAAETPTAIKDSKKLTIELYSGAVMKGGYFNLAVDLEGIECGDRMPVLLEHKRECLMGKVVAATTTGALRCEAELFDTPSTQQVREAEENGMEYQASMGLDPIEFSEVYKGKSTQCNGREVEGPAIVIRKARLLEASCVLWGRDSDTRIKFSKEAEQLMLDQLNLNEPEEEKVEAAAPVTPSAPAPAPVIPTEAAAPPPQRPVAATLSELQAKFSDPAFILECLSEQRTLLASREAWIAREEMRVAKLAAQQAAGSPEPVPAAAEASEQARPMDFSLASLTEYPEGTEPFQTDKDLVAVAAAEQAGRSYVIGDFTKGLAGWDPIPA